MNTDRRRLTRVLSAWWPRTLVILLLTASYALRLYALTRQDIWWDEARNVDVALRPFWQIPTAPELDIHPPFYFWLLHLWIRVVGVEPGQPPQVVAFLVRYLSLAAGIAGAALLYPLARRIGGNQTALWALLLASASPFWLAEAQEARMYTLGFALLAGSAMALLSIAQSGPATGDRRTGTAANRRPKITRQVTFVLLSALALLTHYNALFILLAWYLWWGGLALSSRYPWPHLRRILLCGTATALLVLPLAPIALRQIPTYENPNLTVPSLWYYLQQNVVAYLGGYAWQDGLLFGLGTWWPWVVVALGALGLLLSVVPSATHRHPALHYGSIAFLASWLVGGLLLYYVAVVDRGAFNVRYSSFVTPALYVLLGFGIAGLGRARSWLPLAAGLVLLAGLIPGVRSDLTDPRFFRADTAGLVEWLKEETRSGDVVFVDQKYPFGFYYERYAIDPDVIPVGEEVAPAWYLFVDINTVDERLNTWAVDARRVFWVEWFESDTDPRGAVSFLLEKAGDRAGQQTFQGYRIRWWTLTPPTSFDLTGEMVPLVHRWRNGLATVTVSVPAEHPANEEIPIALRWQWEGGEILGPLKARVAFYNENGSRLVQDDRRLLNDRHRLPAEWDVQDQPLNVYMLELPRDLAPGVYQIRLLVYDAETLEPVELVDAAGNPAGFEPTIGQIRITAPSLSSSDPHSGE